LSKTHDLIVVTSRRISIKPETDKWLNYHFPGCFGRVVYAGMWDNDSPETFDAQVAVTKTYICKQLGVNLIIDDQIKHCESASSAGIKAILFGNYSWNKDRVNLEHNVVAKTKWPEVTEHINAI